VHPAIIDDDLWDAVQTKLQAASAKRRGVKRSIKASQKRHSWASCATALMSV